MARTTKTRVSDTEYKVAYHMGFKEALYNMGGGGMNLSSPITAIARGLSGELIEQNSMAESMAYRRGYQFGLEFKELVRLGHYPDIEKTLKGDDALSRMVTGTVDEVTDLASDPLGYLAEALGL